MKITLYNNHLLIKWENQSKSELKQDMEKSGLVLPKEVEGREQMIEKGEVIAVSDNLFDIHNKALKIKKGDKILFATFTTFDLILDNEQIYAINGKDVIAKI